jgi:hypothetical protein
MILISTVKPIPTGNGVETITQIAADHAIVLTAVLYHTQGRNL